jgi:hypothetical protein
VRSLVREQRLVVVADDNAPAHDSLVSYHFSHVITRNDWTFGDSSVGSRANIVSGQQVRLT